MTHPNPSDALRDAFERLCSYYLSGGLQEVEIELGGNPYRLYQNGNTARLEPMLTEPARRGPLTDDVDLTLAEEIEAHLRLIGLA